MNLLIFARKSYGPEGLKSQKIRNRMAPGTKTWFQHYHCRRNIKRSPNCKPLLSIVNRVRLGCPGPYEFNAIWRLQEHFQNYLPPSTAWGRFFFQNVVPEQGLPLRPKYYIMNSQPVLGCKLELTWSGKLFREQVCNVIRCPRGMLCNNVNLHISGKTSQNQFFTV